MNLFKNIIIALNFNTEDEKAKIDHAIAIAQMDSSVRFTLISVALELSFDPEKDITPVDKQQETILRKTTQQLESIAGDFPDIAKVTCLVEIGVPSTAIVKQVLRGKHDLLLTSTRQNKTVKKHLLGSTMVELMRQCPCPVWAVKPGVLEESTVMVGIHFDEEVADHNDTLNHRLLNIATSIAEKTNKEVHLVNVAKQLNEDISSERLAQLESLVDDVSKSSAKIIPAVLEGNPATIIPDYASEHSVDILVMGMLSRTGLKGFFIGNTAEKIMDDLDCSLLVVKPKEFVSQVTL